VCQEVAGQVNLTFPLQMAQLFQDQLSLSQDISKRKKEQYGSICLKLSPETNASTAQAKRKDPNRIV